jgi:membrane-associated HD superfamily phosphohydrolase
MKKILYFLITLVLLFTPSIVQAEDSDDSRSTLRERIQTRMENVKERMQERVDTRQIRRDARAEKHAERLQTRFTNYYDRLNKIIEKVQTRLSNLLADGKDVTLAQNKLDEAKTKLSEVKVLADESFSLFNSIEADKFEEQKAVALSAKDKANEARKLFIEAHKLIKEAVKLGRINER